MSQKRNEFWLYPLFFVLYEFSVYIANDMIMPGMPHVVREFHADLRYIPQSLSLYLLGGASLQLMIGPISDKIGRRPVLLSGIFLFLIFTVFIALSFSINSFMLFRFFQGMGLSFIGVVGYAVIQELYQEKEAIKLTSIMGNVSILAPLIGPLLGSIFIHYFNWRFVFMIIGIFAFISLLGINYYMPETVHLKYSSNKIPSKNPNLSIIPKINIKYILNNYIALIKNKTYISGVLAFSFALAPFLCWISISPIVLTEKYHLSTLAFGLYQIPIFSGIIIGGLILMKLNKSFPTEYLIKIGFFISTISLIVLLLATYLMPNYLLTIVIPLSIYSIGQGISNPPINRKILFSSSVALGTTSAALSIIQLTVLALATAFMPYVYRNKNDVYFAFSCFILMFIGFIFFTLFFNFHNKRAEKIQTW